MEIFSNAEAVNIHMCSVIYITVCSTVYVSAQIRSFPPVQEQAFFALTNDCIAGPYRYSKKQAMERSIL